MNHDANTSRPNRPGRDSGTVVERMRRRQEFLQTLRDIHALPELPPQGERASAEHRPREGDP